MVGSTFHITSKYLKRVVKSHIFKSAYDPSLTPITIIFNYGQDFNALNNMRECVIDNVSADQMHIYDIPFMVYCGSYDTAVKVRDILSPYGKHMTGTVSIGIREQAVPK